MSNSPPKKYKRPKENTQVTTNPEAPVKLSNNRDEERSECPEQVCPLLAKDSEWVDIVQTTLPDAPKPSSSNVGDDQAILQLVDCEDGPETKPLAIMFPGLLEREPQTLEGVLNRAMSTTEVTKHLVDLGEKANFTFVKKSNKLIPSDKQWLESVVENSNSHCSLQSDYYNNSSGEYEADNEHAREEDEAVKKKRRKKLSGETPNMRVLIGSQISLTDESSGLHGKQIMPPKLVSLGNNSDSDFETFPGETTRNVEKESENK